MKHAEDEMVLLQRLDHPNIIKVYECYEDYSYVYIVSRPKPGASQACPTKKKSPPLLEGDSD